MDVRSEESGGASAHAQHGHGDDEEQHDLTGEQWVKMWEEFEEEFTISFVDPILLKHFPAVLSRVGAEKLSIFVPLCGKCVDMKWLAEQGHRVVGVEIAKKAVVGFFEEQNIPYKTHVADKLTCYKSCVESLDLEVYQGDVLNSSSDVLGTFDAIWDVESLVAIYSADREKYVDVMLSLLKPNGAYLLSFLEGCGHAQLSHALHPLFDSHCKLELLAQYDSMYGGLEPKDQHMEYFDQVKRHVYLISKK